jgi:hypothetical protein
VRGGYGSSGRAPTSKYKVLSSNSSSGKKKVKKKKITLVISGREIYFRLYNVVYVLMFINWDF